MILVGQRDTLLSLRMDGYCPLTSTANTQWDGETEMLLRRSFDADPDLPVTIHIAIDNDIFVYVNGVLIFSVADGQCPFLDEFNVPVPESALLITGNVLAVRAIDNRWPNYVDIRVEGTPPSPVTISPTTWTAIKASFR